MMMQHNILVPCEDCGETFNIPEEYITHIILKHYPTPPAPAPHPGASTIAPPLPRLPAPPTAPPAAPHPNMLTRPTAPPSIRQPLPPPAIGRPALMMPPYLIQNPSFRR